MAIPRIQTYRMPRADELPESRASWRPDPGRSVLLVHDMQEYFLGFYDASASPMVELIESVRLLRERCAASGIPVVYTKQPAEQTRAQRGLLTDLWGPGLTQQPDKHEIVRELAPGSADTVLTKWRYSAFQRTELLDLMRRWGRDQLIVCGVYAHIGCLLTACEAFMNDVQPFLVTDGTADFSRQQHDMAITYVAQRCGVALPTSDVLARSRPASGRAPRGARRRRRRRSGGRRTGRRGSSACAATWPRSSTSSPRRSPIATTSSIWGSTRYGS
ncbi:isochorismatase family protein [Sorangium atrum]|uniref:Isochorismatase family protein n=1 Tax=Sorangium atrum TaxID=2995308 RepID=A0ABT5CAD5_9BACT|nr:isochorismatase family protein [Sorangium aterium]MDC0682117.1 isochorismatase family protein [Sorangium aterium]